MLEGDMVGIATPRRHMLGVIHGENEVALEACMAHAMTASKPGDLGDSHVSHADDALNPDGNVSKGARYGKSIKLALEFRVKHSGNKATAIRLDVQV